MPIRRNCRTFTCLSVTAFALFGITLMASSTSATAETPHRTHSNTAALAVIDSIVVKSQKQRTASPPYISLIRAGTSTRGGVDVGTELRKGDELVTGAQGQVTLRFLDGTDDSPNLVYMDQNSDVTISSACLKSGRIMAWVGINFRFCIGNTTLGVEGTEFVVSAEENSPPKVTVLKGSVFLETSESTETPVSKAAAVTAAIAAPIFKKRLVVPAKKEATIDPKGVTQADVSETEGHTIIDYWSEWMIKADPRGSDQKANLNYTSEAERNQKFKDARFNAVWNNDPASLETVAKVFNDWNEGDKAARTLKLAARVQPDIQAKSEFQTDLAEAERLQGKDAVAKNRVDSVLKREPTNSVASYLKGKIALDAFGKTKAVLNLNVARSFFTHALTYFSPTTTLDKDRVEQELQYTLLENAKQSYTSLNEKPLCQQNSETGITYSGTVNLPALEAGKLKISGPATLFIVGNQFLLKFGTRIYTGTVATVRTGSYIAVALRFDDALRGEYENGFTISLRAVGSCNRLRLETPDKSGSMQIRIGD